MSSWMHTNPLEPETNMNIPSEYKVPRYRVTLVRDPGARKFKGDGTLSNGQAVVSFARPMFRGVAEEHCIAIGLDARNRPIGACTISIGTLSASLVGAREVFRSVILMNAHSFVLVHNHPSGDPEPSREDLGLTRRLRAVGELIGIAMVDHVILGEGRAFTSMSKKENWQ